MSRLKQWGFISINDEWVSGTIQNEFEYEYVANEAGVTKYICHLAIHHAH